MKKAQVTLFIIIGLFALIIVGGIIYYYTTTLSEEKIPELVKVSDEVKPISDFITSCLKSSTIDALKKSGSQGGYVDNKALMSNPYDQTEANSIEFFPESGVKIPYWYHMSSRNDCDETTKKCDIEAKPVSLATMKVQIERYVKEKIVECETGLKDFEKKGFKITLGSATPKIIIAEKNIKAQLDQEATVQKGDVKKRLTNFEAIIDLNLKQILKLASEITAMQHEYNFLENLVIKQIIGTYSGIGKDQLPPQYEVDFKFGSGTIWLKRDVAETMKRLLTQNIQSLQFGGVGNYKYSIPPADVKDKELFELVFNRDLYIPLKEQYPELEAKIIYLPIWNTYFNMNCKGELCMSDSGNVATMFLFGMQVYKFGYDFSYPAVIDIKNPEALEGEGYNFKIALEGNIRNNQIIKATGDTALIRNVELPEENDNCEPQKQTSAPITIKISDGLENKLLDKTAVSYTCTTTCPVGETENGVLKSRLHQCLGGLITAVKQEYHPAYLQFDAEDNEETIELTMHKYKTIQAIPKKYELVKESGNWELTENTALPGSDEVVSIILKRQNENEEAFSTAAEIKGGHNTKPEEMIIIPGKYKVSITSQVKPPKEESLRILPKRRCVKKNIFGGKTCFNIPEKPIEFNKESPFINSKIEYEWELKPEDLAIAKKIIFHYPSIELKKVPESLRRLEDLNQINNLETYKIQLGDKIMPTISD